VPNIRHGLFAGFALKSMQSERNLNWSALVECGTGAGRCRTGKIPMSWTLVISGLAGAAMLALGSGFVWPMGTALGGICDLVGVASTVVFFGLAESG